MSTVKNNLVCNKCGHLLFLYGDYEMCPECKKPRRVFFTINNIGTSYAQVKW